jgi:hypothetical protein
MICAKKRQMHFSQILGDTGLPIQYFYSHFIKKASYMNEEPIRLAWKTEKQAPIYKQGPEFFLNQNSREPVTEPDELVPL